MPLVGLSQSISCSCSTGWSRFLFGLPGPQGVDKCVLGHVFRPCIYRVPASWFRNSQQLVSPQQGSVSSPSSDEQISFRIYAGIYARKAGQTLQNHTPESKAEHDGGNNRDYAGN